MTNAPGSFRPLIRGLSISSETSKSQASAEEVSVPSSGDYQFLLNQGMFSRAGIPVSVPSSGDYQFLLSR